MVGKEPLRFRPALGSNNEPLNERYLINTIPTPDPTTGRYVVNLIFNSEGQKMFGDITERNAGKVIAIFLGNKLLTAPNVSQRIDGNAIITSGAEKDTKAWATELSKNINEGIVPVAIYEHSERTIGPNLGQASMRQLIISGLVGLLLVTGLIFWRYRFDGVVAIAGLIIHVIFLLAMVRLLGMTMTLSGIAGIVLGIGIAIDSNILLLERVKDYLRQGKDLKSSLRLGFEGAWATVWDSNITGLLVGFILWWLGVSLVKGFGQMTVLGIIISLFVVKHMCNPLTVWWRNKMEK
ncbi:MAG: protein translocase subunit SecD [bacterium]